MLEVWYVQGDAGDGGKPLLWLTKEDAERWAREIYPDETIERRYARVAYRRVYAYDEVHHA
jgi:hypothetical protein